MDLQKVVLIVVKHGRVRFLNQNLITLTDVSVCGFEKQVPVCRDNKAKCGDSRQVTLQRLYVLGNERCHQVHERRSIMKYFVFVPDILQGASREIVARMILCDFRSDPVTKLKPSNF